MQILIVLGSMLMMAAVAMGAFGAHALKGKMSADKQKVYETAVLYHIIHALGIIVIGLLGGQYPENGMIEAAGWLMVAGIVLFSGSLYVLSLKRARLLGPITPLGGLSFIAGWLLVALGVL
ncbi:uncharacterized membrane protein YgdD (TMEM256/DUF423 family) [Paenibacillus phyllosphaerae]|uniref:Uncharacterized membrane protein YgdD (TMEM256/DUF423 family) n=1 Tax=Paenibacillus phyllosphaerae TaxID=274593 RepID=A0A7W5AXU3_9BACL|nr:DUF423 domain-containing protein [Paenibacillus phyllosphaerae]MBB3110763.1 uncharacterized membrane protein YgdD (TMEM256/DUF423 family) [Paenibacillus phyllosphaerae]